MEVTDALAYAHGHGVVHRDGGRRGRRCGSMIRAAVAPERVRDARGGRFYFTLGDLQSDVWMTEVEDGRDEQEEAR
jgi:hypothetical protein